MAARQNEQLVEDALRKALQQRRPAPRGYCTTRTEDGSHTSQRYQQVLTQYGIAVSMSRRGNCYDNAVSESFFGTLKRECVERAREHPRAQAKQAIFAYTEAFYNRVRRHSSLGYKSPVVFEQLMS